MIEVIRHCTPKRKPPYGVMRILIILFCILVLTHLFGCTQQPSAWKDVTFAQTPYHKMGMIGSGL